MCGESGPWLQKGAPQLNFETVSPPNHTQSTPRKLVSYVFVLGIGE